MISIIQFLNKIRMPRSLSSKQKFLYSLVIFLFGIILGIISKVLDNTPSNLLPNFFEMLDLRNFFSRIGVWLFLAAALSIFSATPFRAATNVFLFLVGMVASYYIYTVFIIGFYPKSYMMIWIGFTLASPFFSYLCWYAKGKGTIALIISSLILVFLFRQAFSYGIFYFSIRYVLEAFLWIAMIAFLYQNLKLTITILIISTGVSIILMCFPVDIWFGML